MMAGTACHKLAVSSSMLDEADLFNPWPRGQAEETWPPGHGLNATSRKLLTLKS